MVIFDFVLGHWSKEISQIFVPEILACKTENKSNDREYMKIMYGNCGLINECERDLRSSEHYLSSSENKAWKVQAIEIWIHELWNNTAVLYQQS